MSLPEDQKITIIAIQADDVITLGEECTPSVSASIPRAVEAVSAEVEEIFCTN
jgi:hypothetical protein